MSEHEGYKQPLGEKQSLGEKQPLGKKQPLVEKPLSGEGPQKTPFTQLNIEEPILFSLLIQRYLFCASIQAKAIPLIAKKENVLLHSETGSGKTLCFVIPMLQNLVKSKLGAIRRDRLFTSSCGEAKEGEDEEEEDDCYNEDRVNRIYNKFENVNIEKGIPPVDINVAKFMQHSRASLEGKTHKKGGAVGNQAGVTKDGQHPPRGNNVQFEPIKEEVKKAIRCTTSENKSKKKIQVNGVIVAPTRELSMQIYDVVNKFLFFIRLYFVKKFNIHVDELDKEVFFVNTLLFRGAVKIEEDLKIIKNEKKKKKRYQIVVATPGKLSTLLVDHNCHFDTNELAYLILDEGDKLLEQSFLTYVQDVVRSIVSKDYATCICSATCLQEEKFYNLFSDKRRAFTKCVGGAPPASGSSGMGDVVAASAGAGAAASAADAATTAATPAGSSFQMPEQIENYYITVRNLDKSFFLFKFLSTVVREGEAVIVFLPTCFCVDFFFHLFKNVLNVEKRSAKEIFNQVVTLNERHRNAFSQSDLSLFCKMICYTHKYMGKKKFTLLKIHRKMKDKKRISAYKKIKENKNKRRIKIIFCTDIMSRGINVDIHWVINYDVANKNMTYIHRSGRTGRFDKRGKNIILLNKKEKEYIYFLKNKKVNISNFRKTSMFRDMLSWESRLMRSEDALDAQVREVANLEKGQMGKFGPEKTLSFYGKVRGERVKGREAKGIPPKGDSSGGPPHKGDTAEGPPPKRDDHILLLNNMVNLFLKYIIFFTIENRETYLLSTKAFLSYIEFYKNHQLSFLFPFHKLNLSHLCHSFALVKIPKFKEKSQIKNFKRVGLNTSDIPYRNEEKERKRQEELTRLRSEKRAANEKAEGEKNAEGDKPHKRKQEKKQKKRKTIVQRKHEQRDMEENEIESLFFEENLYKKLKKKKISKDEYDRLLNMENLDKIFSTSPSAGKNQAVAPRKNQAAASNRRKSKKKRKVYNLKVKKRRKGGGKRR
ncbi:ATP-dependent RNA helicase [Plasmodium vivax Mauritania I]|uniref:ATP-dependent RNA helicase n=1 Tax=Plasmodium vivax Mauritania I TaxID=1035515 RepID=A0A0J9T6R1_PLAVI|nr:ATP-dependent RNA helicase [Plasmodium vivax Mauritania I]